MKSKKIEKINVYEQEKRGKWVYAWVAEIHIWIIYNNKK